jgi:hypothetical protein
VRIKGIGHLIIILTSSFAKVFIPFSLILPGDSLTKTSSMMILPSDLIIFMRDLAMKLTISVLFKPVNRTVVLLRALFRMVSTTTHGIHLLCRFLALQSYDKTEYLTSSEPGGLYLFDLQPFSVQHRKFIMG